MLRLTVADAAGTIVANRVVLRVSPADFERLRTGLATLERRIERRLAHVASDHGARPAGSLRVTILSDATVRRGIAAHATIEADTPGVRERRAPTRRLMAPAHWMLAAHDGSLIQLPDGASTVGRADDNAVVLDDSRVSRYHARLSLVADRLDVRDLGSTNGTLVNSREVASSQLRPRDLVSFGGVVFRVERA
jgi:hypothetical protein